MNFKLNEGETVSYIDWKVDFYKRFSKKGVRMGQHFCNCFIKNSSNIHLYHQLYNSTCEQQVEHILYIIMSNYHWNLEELVLVESY